MYSYETRRKPMGIKSNAIITEIFLLKFTMSLKTKFIAIWTEFMAKSRFLIPWVFSYNKVVVERQLKNENGNVVLNKQACCGCVTKEKGKCSFIGLYLCAFCPWSTYPCTWRLDRQERFRPDIKSRWQDSLWLPKSKSSDSILERLFRLDNKIAKFGKLIECKQRLLLNLKHSRSL